MTFIADFVKVWIRLKCKLFIIIASHQHGVPNCFSFLFFFVCVWGRSGVVSLLYSFSESQWKQFQFASGSRVKRDRFIEVVRLILDQFGNYCSVLSPKFWRFTLSKDHFGTALRVELKFLLELQSGV